MKQKDRKDIEEELKELELDAYDLDREEDEEDPEEATR